MDAVEAMQKCPLNELIRLTVSRWVKMGINDEGCAVLLHIKNNYIVIPRERPDIILTAADAVKAANMEATNVETMVALYLDHDDRLIISIKIGEGSRDKVAFCIQRINEYANTFSAVKVILLHNHPRGGECSLADALCTATAAKAIDAASGGKCKLHDHLIVFTDKVQSVVSREEWAL